MHQTGHIAAVLHLDRHNEAAVSLGDDILLQVLGALARDHAVERFAHLTGHAAQFSADAQQLGRCTVRDLLLGDDGGRDRFLQITVAGEQTENRRERGLGFVLGIVQQGTARGLQQTCHSQQLARIERAAAVRAGQDRAYLSDAAKGRTALIKGFRSREDKPFDAYLTFDKDFRIVYGFPPHTDKSKGKEHRR